MPIARWCLWGRWSDDGMELVDLWGYVIYRHAPLRKVKR